MIPVLLAFCGVVAFVTASIWIEYLINGRARRKRIARLLAELNRERETDDI